MYLGLGMNSVKIFYITHTTTDYIAGGSFPLEPHHIKQLRSGEGAFRHFRDRGEERLIEGEQHSAQPHFTRVRGLGVGSNPPALSQPFPNPQPGPGAGPGLVLPTRVGGLEGIGK